MGDTTKIQWTDKTFNPWIGCTKVSAGCTNCYADAQDKRWGHDSWGPGKPRRRTSVANWKLPLRWNEQAKAEGRRARVFCASMADVFDAEVPGSWRLDLFELIRRTPFLDWQLLTKRPERIRQELHDLVTIAHEDQELTGILLLEWLDGRPPPNAWLGTSVEDQAAADKRIPELLKVPAAVRFLSCEPLLGPLNLRGLRDDEVGAKWDALSMGIHWVIVGGESGPKARPMDLVWAHSILTQCEAAGVAAFCKQLGANPVGRSGPLHDRKGGDPSEWPPELRVREFPEVRP